jgi:deoxycytidylate deaminase
MFNTLPPSARDSRRLIGLRTVPEKLSNQSITGKIDPVSDSSLPAYTDAELVLGLVAPAGTNFEKFTNELRGVLREFAYSADVVQFSALASELAPDATAVAGSEEYQRLTRLMNAGNDARARGGGEVLALAAAGTIFRKRPRNNGGSAEPLKRKAHVLRSLKHPAEVLTLRRFYGPAFYLIGVVQSEEERRRYLRASKGCTDDEIRDILRRDEDEGLELGQRTRDTFHLADVFIPAADNGALPRFFDLVFGTPYVTPTLDEYAMFLAFTAGLRSADLSRQVGAVVVSAAGDVVAVGANDVPKAKGGLFWPGKADRRDYVLGYDSNEVQRREIINDVLHRLCPDGVDEDKWRKDGWEKLSSAAVMDITEFGRPVHAEMEALLSCGRSGVSTRDATLYSTTFPCHNCAKHILAAGVKRVVYVEPYPKSKTTTFYGDSIRLGGSTHDSDDTRVSFEAFEGIGPRRFFDLFSIGPNSGYPVKRKAKGGMIREDWTRTTAEVRVPLLPNNYMLRESGAAEELMSRFGRTDGGER